MIPDEDRGPGWLRDYGYTDYSQIQADIKAMEQFATKLSANVKDNYAPHLGTVTDAMATRLPDPPSEFIELVTFLSIHNTAQDAAHRNVYNYAGGTEIFMHPTPRGVAIRDTSEQVTAEINQSREYLESRLAKVA